MKVQGVTRQLPWRAGTRPERGEASMRAQDTPAVIDHTKTLYWLLRFACVLEYIGHGAFGIITKSSYVPYFGVVGIPERWAYKLMPLIGSMDITLAFIALFKPIRAVLLYMAVWGLWTALLRPLSGEPFWETVERAPNYLVPFALLYLCGLPHSWRDLLR